jgi:post-segregation antitoxin (ccd killing protein)
VQALRQRQAAEEAVRDAQALQEHSDELIEEPMSPVGDNPEAAATVVEFSDSNGPHAAARRRW